MRNAVIGLIIGIVAGIVFGTTVIAPRLAHNVKQEIGIAEAPPPAEKPKPDPASADGATAKDATPDAGTIEKQARANVRRFNMASAYGEGLAGHGTLARRLETTVWRISDGTLDVRFNPPGALVPNAEAVDAVISGAIDAYFTDMDVLAGRDPSLSLLAGPPFGASVPAYLGWMTAGGGRELLDGRLNEMGLGGVPCGIIPHAAGGWFRKPLKTAQDFKGMRIRASGPAGDMFRHLGAEVVDFSYAETLIAMESGLLDGAQISAPHVDLALGAQRSGWTYYIPGWRTPAKVFVLLMAKDTWAALSEVQRAQLATACSDNIRHAIATGEALQFDALKEIIKSGADVQPWPGEVTDAMRNAWDEITQELQKSNRPYSRIRRSWRQYVKGQSVWEDLVRPR